MTQDLFQLDGKVAVVTGASRGIGEAIARLLASHGAKVVISSRRIEGCESVAKSIVADGGEAYAFPCNIGKIDQVDALFKYVKAEQGTLDVLVNNAATNPYFGHVLDTPLSAFQKTIDVNIRGYFYASVEGAKLMRDTGGGAILNTASINALQPAPSQGIYSISKAAVVSMTKAFAKECGQFNVRVNALLPGLTETEFASALIENKKLHAAILEDIPLGRHAKPEEMAATALLLLSGAGSYITGECIVVDGGKTL